MVDTRTPWPDGKRAAVSFTMDNMGEAAEIQRGEWPAGQPVGAHHAVVQSLPNLLDLLDELDVRTTYFIEGWNADVYPDTIRGVARRGHEIGFHGWQHEQWSGLGRDEEAGLIDRSTRAMRALDLDITGFRPPGGVLTESSARLLQDAGIRYCSPAGREVAMASELVHLPFEWQSIDAYYYSPGFAGLRSAKGDPTGPLAPRDFADRTLQIVQQRIDSGGYVAILFHPFLEIEPERIAAMDEIIRAVTDDDRVWCATCHEVATWVRTHPDRFGTDPGFDTTTWPR